MIKKFVAIMLIVCMCIPFLPTTSQGAEIFTGGMVNIQPQAEIGLSYDAMVYALPPDNLYPFIYDGEAPSTWREIDTADCVIGRLYIFNEDTQAVTEVGTDAVVTFAATKDHLFYVTDTQKIIQTDYSGSFFTELHQVEAGTLTMINTFGNYMYFVENDNLIVIWDVPDRKVHAAVKVDSAIGAYLFAEDQLVWYDSAGNPFYYNISTGQQAALEDDNAVSVLTQPYVMPPSNTETWSIQNSTVVNDVGVPDEYNDVAFPLPNYKARPGTGYIPSVIISDFLDDDGNSLEYAGEPECDGFAKYAHDEFWHIADWTLQAPSWDLGSSYTADYHGQKTWSSQAEMIDFFEGMSRGSFVRYVSKADESPANGTHSYVFDGVDPDGLGTWHYECNQDRACGVGYQYYTFSLYYCKNKELLYYVEHTLSTNKTYYSADRHKTPCTNCDGYLLQTHTGQNQSTYYSITRHTNAYTCCSGSAQVYHTAEQANVCYDLYWHNVQFDCCTGYESEYHTGDPQYSTIVDRNNHGVQYDCCEGTGLQAHYYTPVYTNITGVAHTVYAGCCDGMITEPHTLGARDACIYCGYCEGLQIMGKEPEEIAK